MESQVKVAIEVVRYTGATSVWIVVDSMEMEKVEGKYTLKNWDVAPWRWSWIARVCPEKTAGSVGFLFGAMSLRTCERGRVFFFF